MSSLSWKSGDRPENGELGWSFGVASAASSIVNTLASTSSSAAPLNLDLAAQVESAFPTHGHEISGIFTP